MVFLTASFQYDAGGRRKSKTVNGTTTNFLYDGLNVVQELNGTTPSANLLTSLGIDETLLRTDSVGARSFLSDGLGSTLALTDSAGLVQGEYTYEPFGQTTATGAASTNAFKYTGREDDGTGLYYYRARYYHPALQRFVSEDPIGFDGGDVNLYGYVTNDPLNLTDPLGHNAMAGAQAGGAAGGMVCGPPCAVVGAGVGLITGAIIGQCIWDFIFETRGHGERGQDRDNPNQEKRDKRKQFRDGKWMERDNQTGKWKPTTPPANPRPTRK